MTQKVVLSELLMMNSGVLRGLILHVQCGGNCKHFNTSLHSEMIVRMPRVSIIVTFVRPVLSLSPCESVYVCVCVCVCVRVHVCH